MTTLNAYATLKDYKDYIRARNLSIADDVVDDTVIEFLLVAASRLIDEQTGRNFTPYVSTFYYDVPDSESLDRRLLRLDCDLLEVLTLTNGDGTVIPSTEYNLVNKNRSPYYGIRLKDTSTYYWTCDAAGDSHSVISLECITGYHNRYSTAWATGSTAAEAMDDSETGYDVTSGANFAAGNIIRFDDELGYVSSVATNTLTITRGANGSTATTHLTSIDVKIWQVMELAKYACIEIANSAYFRRFGQSTNEAVQITAAGIILSPLDIPQSAGNFIKTFRRYD